MKRYGMRVTILCLVMGILVFGFLIVDAVDDYNPMIIVNETGPDLNLTVPLPNSTPGSEVTIGQSVMLSSEQNSPEYSMYVDTNETRNVITRSANNPLISSSVQSDSSDRILLVSNPDTLTAGYSTSEPVNPLDAFSYSNSKWSSSALATWSGPPSWYNPEREPFTSSGASWISTKETTEGGNGDSWRLFKEEFTIPEGFAANSADLWYSADNAVAVYLNDELIATTATVYGPSSDKTPVYDNYYHVTFNPKAGANTLKFVVRNWAAPFYNPTGLIFRSEISLTQLSYSMTNTAYRTDTNTPKGRLMDTSLTNCQDMESKLDHLGWKQEFYHSGSAVTKGDFGIDASEYQKTINSAVLHFHQGHGSPQDSGGHTFLALMDQNNNDYPLYASEVTSKWGGNNKWVILDSCYLLLDDDWGKALSSSHGIMGFKTQVDNHPKFAEKFLYYAIDEKQTVYDAFIKTTRYLYKDSRLPLAPDSTEMSERVIASAIFMDKNQAKFDYLPGVETGVYSEPASGDIFRKEWPCDKPPQGGIEL